MSVVQIAWSWWSRRQEDMDMVQGVFTISQVVGIILYCWCGLEHGPRCHSNCIDVTIEV